MNPCDELYKGFFNTTYIIIFDHEKKIFVFYFLCLNYNHLTIYNHLKYSKQNFKHDFSLIFNGIMKQLFQCLSCTIENAFLFPYVIIIGMIIVGMHPAY